MLRRLVAASFATSFSVLAACSGGDPIVPVDSNPNSNDTFTYAENTAWTDADVAREVTVEEGRLLLPLAYEGYARGLPIGSVLASDRAPGGAPNNPMGFLRRIEGVEVRDGRVVIATSGASLEDLFAEAHLTMAGEPGYGAPLDDPAIEPLGETGTRNADGLQLQQQGQSSAGMSFESTFGFSTPKLKSSNNGIAANVSWEGSLRRRFDVRAVLGASYNGRGWLEIPNIDISLDLPWTQTDTACSLTSGEVSYAQLEGALRGLPIPVFSQSLPAPPLGPVPTSVRAEIKLACGPFVSGRAEIQSTTTTTGNVSIEFGTDRDGNFYGRADKTQAEPTKTMSYIVQGTGGVKCKITARVGFYFFDWIGAYTEYGLGAEASVTGQGKFETGQSPEGVACFDIKRTDQVDVGLSASKWGLTLERSTKIWEQVTPLVHACTSDGCANREDGWYCDTASPAGGFRCANRSKAAGSACPSGQFCQVSDPLTRQARMAGEEPECGTTQPSGSSTESLSCR